MATVTALTKERMEEIEGNSIVAGFVDVDGHLLLTKHNEEVIDAGSVASTSNVEVSNVDTSVQMTLSGLGTPATPYELSADLAMRETTDWDLATEPGLYWSTDAANSPTQESGDWVLGVVTRHPGPRIVQEVRRAGSSVFHNSFVRYHTGTSWTAWQLNGGVGRGSSTDRNNLFGVPATDAERVALANRKIIWYNTTYGWEESYYATTGLTGLTVTGLVSGIASGWYPTGAGPECVMEPNVTFPATTGAYIGNWNGTVRRKGGVDHFIPASTYMSILLPGLYDLDVWTIQPGGTGQADYHARLLNSAGTVVDWMSNVSIAPLSSSYISRVSASFNSQIVRAGQRFCFLLSAGTLDVHQVSGGTTYPSTRGQLAARYVRPALVSD